MARKNGPTEDDRDTEVRTEQTDLRRAAHKIAWSRMNGRDDTSNPFADSERNRSAEVDRHDRL